MTKFFVQSRWYRERNLRLINDHEIGVPLWELIVKYNLLSGRILEIISHGDEIKQSDKEAKEYV